jgi:hypothetical protein
MGWIKKWSWLLIIILAISLIVGWKEKRCQSQAYQCGAAYAAESQSESLTRALTVDQQASEQEGIAAACEPNGYFCRLFSAANLPSMLLVLVGLGGIYAAIRTLRAIESQTSVLSESQQPRIIAEAGEHPNTTLSEKSETPRVVLKVTNKGPTSATNYIYESWIEILPDTSGDFTAGADYYENKVVSVLYPDAPQKINIPLRGGISEEDRRLVRDLKKHVCIRLRVEYQDPFITTRRCYADFGFYVLPDAFGFLSKHNGVGYEDKKA